MRVIHKASLVFLLKDVYNKAPIDTAVILCDGKQNPYVRKKSGHYVFSDLFPGNYEISITCKGYNGLKFPIELKENETKVMNFDLSYTSDNPNISNSFRFEITLYHLKKRAADQEAEISLADDSSFMKLIENADAGAEEIKLNIDEMTDGIIGQKYIYEVKKQKQEIKIEGFNAENKTYTLDKPLEEALESGGKFYPKWDVRTDAAGRVIMPFIGQFMEKNPINLKFLVKDGEETLKSKAEIDLAGDNKSDKIFYEEVKLRKSSTKNK